MLAVAVSRYSARPGDEKCAESSSESTLPIDCPRNEEIVNSGTGCSIKQDGGIYRAEVKRWQEIVDCKCMPREETTLKLCACKKPEETATCQENSKLAIERISYTKSDNRCLPTRQKLKKDIRKFFL